ncbi:hypothetical protein HK101_011472 [Irineochytrium annulatum]|nr:hypothetical protein HK101_011472 [Irineochytrium annulatum]
MASAAAPAPAPPVPVSAIRPQDWSHLSRPLTSANDLANDPIVAPTTDEIEQGRASVVGPPTVTLRSRYPDLPADDSEPVVALVTVTAPSAPTEACAAVTAMDLVACVDVSGSMSGDKIDNVLRTLSYVVSTLRPEDRLAIVAFNDSATVLAPFLHCGSSSQEANPAAWASAARLESVINNNIRAGGGTNIQIGVNKSLDLLERRFTGDRNPLAAVLLLSDGQDNIRQNYNRLLERSTRLAIPIFTFGYGVGVDDRCLSTIAGSSGTFTFIRTNDVIQDAFAGCVGAIRTTVYKDVTVTVSIPASAAPSNGYSFKIRDIHSSYPVTIAAGLQTATVALGDLFAEETRDAVISLTAQRHLSVSAPRATPIPVITADVSYTIIATSTLVHSLSSDAVPLLTLLTPSAVNLRAASARPAADAHVNRQQLRVLALQSIKEAQSASPQDARALLLTRREWIVQAVAGAVNCDPDRLRGLLPPAPTGNTAPAEYTLDMYPVPTGEAEIPPLPKASEGSIASLTADKALALAVDGGKKTKFSGWMTGSLGWTGRASATVADLHEASLPPPQTQTGKSFSSFPHNVNDSSETVAGLGSNAKSTQMAVELGISHAVLPRQGVAEPPRTRRGASSKLPSTVLVAPDDWKFALAVLEDMDGVIAGLGERDEGSSAMMSCFANAYGNQRQTWTSVAPMAPTTGGAGSAKAVSRSSRLGGLYQSASSAVSQMASENARGRKPSSKSGK